MAGPEATVTAVGPDGAPINVPVSKVQAVEDAGGHVMGAAESAQVKKRIALEDQFSGVEGAVGPALAGAARGVTLGGSDVLLGNMGPGVRRRLLDYQDYDPIASMGGEVGGIAAAALVGDEAGIGRLPGLVSKLGAGAETAVAWRLGGGMLARGAGMAARGAGEGAIYAAGKAYGDAALHNEELTAEKATAAIGHGAMFGAGANVLLGGAGAGLSKLLSRESGEVGAIASRVEGGVQRESTGLGDALQKGADVKTIKALGGSAGDLAALERGVPGGFRKVAQDIRGDLETTTGKSIGLHSRESLHEYATARVEELGDKLGGMLKKLDESGSGIAPDIKSFAANVREKLITPNTVQLPSGALVSKPGQHEVVKAAEGWLDDVAGAYSYKAPTFTEWQQARVALDKQINFAARNASPEMGALKQIRGMMEKELEVSGEAAARNVGGAFADEYQATKSLYQSVRKAQDLTERGVARQLANNSFGLGATIGAATGMATGGPIAGAAMGLAGKVIKDRGDMLAADLLHRAANIAGVQRLAAQTDATMSKGIAALLGAKAPVAATTASVVRVPVAPMGVALSGNLRGDFKKVSAEVVKAASNPTQTTDRVAKALGPEAAKSPKIAGAVTQLMLGDIDYLHKQLPPPRLDAYSLQPHLQKDSRASDSEMSKWMQQAEVLANPTMVLDEAKAGTLSRTHVEALKERRPEMYQAIRSEVLEQVVNTKEEIPYARRIQLGILLDIPTDRTLAPDFQQAIQATYSSAEQAGEESPPPLSRPLAIASAQATPLVGAMTEGLEK